MTLEDGLRVETPSMTTASSADGFRECPRSLSTDSNWLIQRRAQVGLVADQHCGDANRSPLTVVQRAKTVRRQPTPQSGGRIRHLFLPTLAMRAPIVFGKTRLTQIPTRSARDATVDVHRDPWADSPVTDSLANSIANGLTSGSLAI